MSLECLFLDIIHFSKTKQFWSFSSSNHLSVGGGRGGGEKSFSTRKRLHIERDDFRPKLQKETRFWHRFSIQWPSWHSACQGCENKKLLFCSIRIRNSRLGSFYGKKVISCKRFLKRSWYDLKVTF